MILHNDALLLGLGGLLGHLAVDLPHKVEEHLVDVDLLAGRGLQEGDTSPAAGEVSSLLLADHAVVLQVALVATEDHGDLVGVLHTENLLAEVGEVVEGGLGGNGVDENEALAVLHVQITHGSELLGTSGIENLEHALLTVDLNLFSVRVLDGGVVLFDEDGLDKLDGL